jgi:dipeptide/tripeptide permease
MTRREKLHPMLWGYKVLADPRFIVAVNLIFAVMLWEHVGEDKLDFPMSWATMAMDMVIIGAGWRLVQIGVKHRKEDRALWSRIERQNAALLRSLGIPPAE